MEQQAKVRTGFVAGDFMTSTYRISGEVALRGDPLLDQLNNLNTLFLTLERVFVSPLLDPAVLTGNYPNAEVRKDNVGIVILNQHSTTYIHSRRHHPSSSIRYRDQTLKRKKITSPS